MRRGYTLIEIIITVAITGILAIGMFKAFEAITLRSEKAKILTTLSIDSQSALDQISLLLYNRAPMSVKGCTNPSDCVPLDENTENKTILQWYGTASESYQKGNYSGFIDMAQSSKPDLFTPDTNPIAIANTQTEKWETYDVSQLGLKFAGAFENGIDEEAYRITSISDNHITLSILPSDDKIYEKYYIVDSAYAVTRKKNNPCGVTYTDEDENDLLLYYDFRPWNEQTMCDGKVSLLSSDVSAFSAHYLNGTIRLGIDMNRSVRGSKNPVRLSKQKVVF